MSTLSEERTKGGQLPMVKFPELKSDSRLTERQQKIADALGIDHRDIVRNGMRSGAFATSRIVVADATFYEIQWLEHGGGGGSRRLTRDEFEELIASL